MKRVWVWTWLMPAALWSQEGIRTYDAAIRVQSDGSLEITETLVVQVEGNKIRRGIFKDLDRLDEFAVLSVTRNGAAEPYTVEDVEDFRRIRIGDSEKLLSIGEHTYTVQYRCHHVLRFFNRHDELYWNVTGNGWSFPIDRATAMVVLPQRVVSGLQVKAYTGPKGYAGTDFRSSASGNRVFVETTRQLLSGDGLTIVVGWPPGPVQRIEEKIFDLNVDMRLDSVGRLTVWEELTVQALGVRLDSVLLHPVWHPDIVPQTASVDGREVAMARVQVDGDDVIEIRDTAVFRPGLRHVRLEYGLNNAVAFGLDTDTFTVRMLGKWNMEIDRVRVRLRVPDGIDIRTSILDALTLIEEDGRNPRVVFEGEKNVLTVKSEEYLTLREDIQFRFSWPMGSIQNGQSGWRSLRQTLRLSPGGTLSVRQEIGVVEESYDEKHWNLTVYKTPVERWNDPKAWYSSTPTRNISLRNLSVLVDGEPAKTTTDAWSSAVQMSIPLTDTKRGAHRMDWSYEISRQVWESDTAQSVFWLAATKEELGHMDSLTIEFGSDVPAKNVFLGTRFVDGTLALTPIASEDGVTSYTLRNLYRLSGLDEVWLRADFPPGSIDMGSPILNTILDHRLHLWWAPILASILIFLVFWVFVGRDPQIGTIVPSYQPPRGMSPAAMRYLQRPHRDPLLMALALVHAAVRGKIKIKESAPDRYDITVLSGLGDEYDDEHLKAVLSKAGTVLRLDGKANASLAAVRRQIEQAIVDAYGKEFKSNIGWWLLGVLMSGVLMVAALMFTELQTLSESYLMGNFVLYGAIMVVVYGVFLRLLARPSEVATTLRREIEGFKMFLSVTDKDRYEWMGTLRLDEALFERYLPYAMALGIEDNWAEKFRSIIRFEEYKPAWFDGDSRRFAGAGLHALTRSMRSSVVQTAKEPPPPPSSSGGSGYSGSSRSYSSYSSSRSSGFSRGSSGGGSGSRGGGGW